jgi:hypothetical protein
MRTPQGITPPAPGLDREEPTQVDEEDIPSADNAGNGSRADGAIAADDRLARGSERE